MDCGRSFRCESGSGGGPDEGGGANTSPSHRSVTSHQRRPAVEDVSAQSTWSEAQQEETPPPSPHLSIQTTRRIIQHHERWCHTLHNAAERGGEMNSDILSCLSAVRLRCRRNLHAPSLVPASSPSRQCPLPLNTERQGTAALPVLEPISPRLLSASVGRMSAGFYCGGNYLAVFSCLMERGGGGPSFPPPSHHPPVLETSSSSSGGGGGSSKAEVGGAGC